VTGRGLRTRVRRVTGRDELEALEARLGRVDETVREHHALEQLLARELDELERVVLGLAADWKE
jgi:hypothetical protein